MMEMSDVQYRAKDACTLLVETKNVQIVMDRNQCDESVSCLEIETEGKPVVVGMDCEWVSEGSKPGKVALLQLSSLQHCVLVRLCCLQDGIPESLRGFLESRRSVVKCRHLKVPGIHMTMIYHNRGMGRTLDAYITVGTTVSLLWVPWGGVGWELNV